VSDEEKFPGINFDTLNQIATHVHETSQGKGWHTEEDDALQAMKDVVAELELEGLPCAPHFKQRLEAAANRLQTAIDAERIALIQSEASEALEILRDPHMEFNVMYYEDKTSTSGYRTKDDYYYEPGSKPIGAPSEYADIIIRVLHHCARRNIDIASAVREKMAYNLSRPFKHGGKKV
jgi:hypothetical protein